MNSLTKMLLIHGSMSFMEMIKFIQNEKINSDYTGYQMHELFLQGWRYELECNIPAALKCYEEAKKYDQCALFHVNCMSRCGEYIPIDVNSDFDACKFILNKEEF